MKNSDLMVKVAIAALEDKKANDIKVLDISDLSPIADYFIIASGENRNKVQAMADNVQEMLYKECEAATRNVEGYNTAAWILLDFNDIIVHVFSDEDRNFYDLERIWKDGKDVDIEQFK